MKMKKSLLACAVGTAVGASAIGAQAATVTGIQLGDVLVGGASAGTDGKISDFNFGSAPNGLSPNRWGATGETCDGGGTACGPISFDTGANATNTFSTGFNFGGSGVFAPNSTGNLAATLTGTTMTITSFPFGGIFQGGQFFLGPDSLTNCTGTANCGKVAGNTATNSGYSAKVVTAGFAAGTAGVLIQYVGTIVAPGSPFNSSQSNWRIEGTISTASAPAIPVPAAAWLMGSGLVGLAGVARRRKKDKKDAE